jgi:integrase
MAAAAVGAGCPAPALPLRRRARHYRDGLMIALLATRPLRLANLAQLELGRELVQRAAGWWLEIPGAATKSGELIELPFPDDLVEALEIYLAVWRPQPARPERVAASHALWLTHLGTRISDIHAYINIVAHTRDAFGQSVNPHLFRDDAATTIALDNPRQVRIAARLLGHRSFATTERHYNLARMAEAAAAWQDTLDQLRGQ